MALVALAPMLLASCSSTADDADAPVLGRVAVERQVRTQLAREVGREPEQVRCPGDLTGVVDQQMRCQLTDAGTELGMTLTVTGVDGDDVDFDIAVDEEPRDG